MLRELREKLKWLDPFTYVDLYVMPRVNPKENEYLAWAVYIVFAFIFAYVFYTGLGLLMGTASPMVIVVSASMEPVLYRGDVVFLQGVSPENLNAPEVELNEPTLNRRGLNEFARIAYLLREDGALVAQQVEFLNGTPKVLPIEKTGDIVVYYSALRDEPVIHRIAAKLHAQDGYYLLTKGDNVLKNTTLDQDCGTVSDGVPQQSCITLYPLPVQNIDGRMLFKIPLIGCAKLWIFDNLGSLATTGKLPENFSGFC
ncbi:MAG: hypothetical protein ABH854_00430 [Candidatus Diapherotrites archaeon]|nr:hypothetical protein [Candidatus Micrarchaeota archaeon]MBU1939899.1 hypothetical protein [Candidatus Micrarchaeota archaeon]